MKLSHSLYTLILTASTIVFIAPEVTARCRDVECACGVLCQCAAINERAASVITTQSLTELQTIIGANQRVIVKFFKTKCPACSFGISFDELVQESNDGTVFVAFNAIGALQDAVKAEYDLPSLPAIVLFVDGEKESVLKI